MCERSSIWQNHWQYGRWIGATGLVSWFNGYIYYFLLPIWGGLAATGALKAILNLVMPILQSDAALVTLLTPAFVRSRREPGQFTRVDDLVGSRVRDRGAGVLGVARSPRTSRVWNGSTKASISSAQLW